MDGATRDARRLLLVGMSAREAADDEALRALAAPYAAHVAHLQLGDPSLARVLDRLADESDVPVDVVGVSQARLAPGASWLRRVAGHWWRERTGPRPEVAVAPTLVGDADVLRAIVTDSSGALLRPLDGREAPMVSAAWEDVPAHAHQVLLCRGPRCTARGSEAVAEALVLELMRLGQGDDDVLLTHTACLFPCNHAPVVAVQPDDTWYGAVTPDAVRRIATEHLVEHRPVCDLQLPRHRKALS